MKILLVEDDANLREVTQRSLEKERYVVEIAADYRTALQKIEDYDYDCILLDIMLPDGSGLDLLEKLKEMHKRENLFNTRSSCRYRFCYRRYGISIFPRD
jgi:DNA-binding response OmpR family regulator